ncbi:ATP-binding protein [Neobacillus notoginsengisoli]|uniref:ATP-binding protein n=1 Tax=Neobacillus notoginsengisoli TaxID=1578198 RepID=A0A417YEV6_9BACI|nr:ATP-binding protein [Neobacillus notoginsengisoli]RHW31193.1 ATP-binding protein [Neobacillus notoginsengisoli]
MQLNSRVTVLAGHFGSGKTELALNMAIKEAGRGNKVAIADLDVINPYFRSRDIAEILNEHGVELIGPPPRLASSDLPIVSGEIYRVLHDPSYKLIIDAGGEKDGATVLGQYFHEWKELNVYMLFVLNANRPYVSTEEGAVDAVLGIESAARLRIGGIINNTNLGAATTPDDVIKGEKLALAVTEKLGVPFALTSISRQLEHSPEFMDREGLFIIDRYMKLPWE